MTRAFFAFAMFAMFPARGAEITVDLRSRVEAFKGGGDWGEVRLTEALPPDQFYKAWTREHPGLRIAENDVVSDSGAEIYSFLREHGIRNLLVMGVHTNMCVLNRSFAIKKMTSYGVRCILVRDLTDAMYSP